VPAQAVGSAVVFLLARQEKSLQSGDCRLCFLHKRFGLEQLCLLKTVGTEICTSIKVQARRRRETKTWVRLSNAQFFRIKIVGDTDLWVECLYLRQVHFRGAN